MGKTSQSRLSRLKRKKRIQKKIRGTKDCPRLSVFRSSRHIYAQIIDDTNGSTLAFSASNEKDISGSKAFENKVSQAKHIGKLVAERARDKGVERIVFDRNGFLYHGRIKAVSEGAREGGLKF